VTDYLKTMSQTKGGYADSLQSPVPALMRRGGSRMFDITEERTRIDTNYHTAVGADEILHSLSFEFPIGTFKDFYELHAR
jgi:hypothetical protein